MKMYRVGKGDDAWKKAILIILSLVYLSFIIFYASPSLVEASPSTHVEELIKSGQPIVVMFWTTYCPVCEKVKPLWLELEVEQPIKGVTFIDVGFERDGGELFFKYDIKAVPTFILFKEGRPIARMEGASYKGFKESIVSWVKEELEKTGYSYVTSYLSVPLLFLTGLGIAVSPCVLPILTSQLAVGGGVRGKKAILQTFLAALGVFMVAGLIAVLGGYVVGFLPILALAASMIIFVLGLAYLLGLYEGMSPRFRIKGDLWGPFTYGLLGMQCSIPLAAGALLGIGSGSTGLLGALAFSLGIAIPYGLASFTAKGFLRFIEGREGILQRIGGLALIILALYIVLENMGIIALT